MWNSFFEDFGLTQYVSEKTHRSGGILDHIMASNNISINVKSNSFITSSDHSFICFSLSSVKQRKSPRRLMYRNWKKFDSDGFIKLIKLCLKSDVASSIDEALDMYLRFEEKILDSVLPLKIKTFTKHHCPFFDDELLRSKRKKRKAERKHRKSKLSVLKSEYKNVTHMYFEKFLEKRRLYIENALMENSGRKRFATLKLLLGQDVEQLPKYENKKQLANDFNEFFISKVKSIIASIPTARGPEILKTEVNSMYSFTELSISQFRDLISASSNSTSPLEIIPTHLVKSFSDHYFLDLLKLLNLRGEGGGGGGGLHRGLMGGNTGLGAPARWGLEAIVGVGGSTGGGVSQPLRTALHTISMSPKQFELKQSWKALKSTWCPLGATWLSRFWGRKVKSVRRKIGQEKNCIKKTDRTNIIDKLRLRAVKNET